MSQKPTPITESNVTKLSAKQIADFKEAFSLFDTNRDNSISSEEIAKVFESLGQNVTKEQLEDILTQFDTDKNGGIDFDEFLQLMIAKMQDTADEKALENQVHAAFKMFDADGNGKIDVNELFNAMKKLGEEVSLEEAATMLKEADTDHDGYIDREEFEKMFQF